MLNFEAGERFTLTQEDRFLLLTKGKVEVYAVTRSKEDFRQEYLVTLAPGEAVFPAWDEFESVDILIYNVEPSELEEVPFQGAEPEKLRPLMERWLKQLLEVPRMQDMLAKGDDVMKSWDSGAALAGCASLSELVEEFKDNQRIMAMLAGNEFIAGDKRLASRLERLEERKRVLLDASIGELLDDGSSFFELAEGGENSYTESTAYAVRCAQKALFMSEGSLYLPQEIIK
jgi:ATP-binding cassette subfamily C protein